jgi:hypothetical protein
MSQDVLKPQDESDAAKNRNVQPAKGSPSSVPTMGAPEQINTPQQAQPQPEVQQQPITPSVPQQTPSPIRGQGLFGDINPVHPSRFVELNSANIGTMTDPTEQMRTQVSNMVNMTDPAVLGSKLNAQAQYQQLDLGLNQEAVWDRTNRQYDAAKKEYDRFVKTPVFGQPKENMSQLPDGTFFNKIPSTDAYAAMFGLNSELGKTLQDKVDPSGTYNTQRTIGQFLFEDAWNLLREGEKFMSNRIGNINRIGWTKEQNAQYNQMVQSEFEGTMGRLGDSNKGFRITTSNTNEGLGDYGNAGLVSGILFGLNTIPSVLTGGIYDLSDEFIRYRTGKDPYEGSRAVDAVLKARDWTISNRWSQEKYMGLQEPENLPVGQRTGVWWWDLPENVAEKTHIDPKLAHWIIQGGAAVGSDIIGDWGIDNLTVDLAKKGIKNTTNMVITGNTMRNDVIELAMENAPDEVKAQSFINQVDNIPDEPKIVNVEPKRRNVPQFLLDEEAARAGNVPPIPEYTRHQVERQVSEVVSIDGERSALVTSLDAENVYGTQVRPTPEPLPSGAVVAKPEELVLYADPVKAVIYDTGDMRPSSVTEVVQRNNGQLTVIAQNLSKDGNGIVPVNFVGVLTDNEIAALRRRFPNEMSRYGFDIDPAKLQADYIMLDDGSVIPKPRLMLTPAEQIDILDTPDDLIGEFNRVQEDIVREHNKLLGQINDESITPRQIDAYTEKVQGLEAESRFNVAQIVDRGQGYEIVYKELPPELQSATDEVYDLGNQMVQHQLTIDDQMTTVVKLREQADNLADASVEAQQHLDQLGGVDRQPLLDSEFTQDWSGGNKIGLDDSTDGGALAPFEADVDYRSLDDIYESSGETYESVIHENWDTPEAVQHPREWVLNYAADIARKEGDNLDEFFNEMSKVDFQDHNEMVTWIQKNAPESLGEFKFGDPSSTILDYLDQGMSRGESLHGFKGYDEGIIPRMTEGVPKSNSRFSGIVNDMENLHNVDNRNTAEVLDVAAKLKNTNDYLYGESGTVQPVHEAPVVSEIQVGEFDPALGRKRKVSDLIGDLEDNHQQDIHNAGQMYGNVANQQTIAERGVDIADEIVNEAPAGLGVQPAPKAQLPQGKVTPPTTQTSGFQLPDQSLNKNRGIQKGDVYLGDTDKGDPVALLPDGNIKYVKTNMMGKQQYASFAPSSPQLKKWKEAAKQATSEVVAKPTNVAAAVDETPAAPASAPRNPADPRKPLPKMSEPEAREVFVQVKKDLKNLGTEVEVMPDNVKAHYTSKGQEPPIALYDIEANKIYFDAANKAQPNVVVYQLRHEATHAMQKVGGEVKPLGIDVPQEYKNYIDEVYKAKGASPEQIQLEYEAFYLQENPNLFDEHLASVKHKPVAPEIDTAQLEKHRQMLADAQAAQSKFHPSEDVGVESAKPFKVTVSKPVSTDIPQNVWLHGTKTSKTLDSVDVITGAAPNELGKGVYLTQDNKVANASARRISPVNRPSIPDATFSSDNARIVRVDVSAINKGGNILDLSTPIGATGRGKTIKGKLYQTFNDAALSATDDPSFAKYYMEQVAKKATSQAWNKFRTAYKEFYHQAPPESVVNNFQKSVTHQFKKDGIFGGIYKGADGSHTLVVYEPKYLKELDELPVKGTNQFSEGLEAQRYLDQRTHDMMPDEVNLANYEASKKAQLDYKLQQTSEALLDETVKTVDEVDAYFDVRKEIMNETIQSKRAVIDNLERNTPDVSTTKVGKQRAARYNKRQEINPC